MATIAYNDTASLSSRTFPYVLLAGRVLHDPAFDLRTRLLVALQELGASGDAWTPPLTSTELGDRVHASRWSVARALTHLLAKGYITRNYVSRPCGGHCYQYKLILASHLETAVPQ